MRVLVTGAAGKLGRVVTQALVEAGHDVVAADVRPAAGLPVPVKLVNLLDRLDAHRVVEGREAVVHLANHPDMLSGFAPAQIYSDNVAMNVNTLEAAVAAGCRRVVFASSVQALGGERTVGEAEAGQPSRLPYLPVDGAAPARPMNLYGLSKAATEQMLRYYVDNVEGFAAVAIRFPSLPSERHLGYYAATTPREPSPRSRVDEAFSYLTQPDAARLIAAVLDKMAPGYDPLMPAQRGNRLGMPPAELIERYYQGVELRRPADQIESLVDLDPLRERYGWAPTPVEELEYDDAEWRRR